MKEREKKTIVKRVMQNATLGAFNQPREAMKTWQNKVALVFVVVVVVVVTMPTTMRAMALKVFAEQVY